MSAKTAIQNDRFGARFISELKGKHWRSALSSSPGAILVIYRCRPAFSIESRRNKRSKMSRQTVPTTHANAMTTLPTVTHALLSSLARTGSYGSHQRRSSIQNETPRAERYLDRDLRRRCSEYNRRSRVKTEMCCVKRRSAK